MTNPVWYWYLYPHVFASHLGKGVRSAPEPRFWAKHVDKSKYMQNHEQKVHSGCQGREKLSPKRMGGSPEHREMPSRGKQQVHMVSIHPWVRQHCFLGHFCICVSTIQHVSRALVIPLAHPDLGCLTWPCSSGVWGRQCELFKMKEKTWAWDILIILLVCQQASWASKVEQGIDKRICKSNTHPLETQITT